MWNCDGWMSGIFPGAGNFFMGLWPFGGIMGLVIILLVVFLIYKLFKAQRSGSSTNADSDKHDSFRILEVRLARGDISVEEYQRMREILLQK